MPRSGRCAGCGRTGSLTKISLHIVECDKYADLYTQDPNKALDPEAEFLRHRRDDMNPEARARQRGHRLTARFAEINRQQAASATRWLTPPDILDD